MTARRPLVRVNGRTRQLPAGDYVTGTAARFFGELIMLTSRQSSPDGVVKADGQLISNALAQYPQAVADLQSATPSVPVTTAANWVADPLSRVCWAYDAANDQIRIPDWNGMSAGAIGPLMFRGDGTLGFAPGKARMDQIQNITGSFGQTFTLINTNTAAQTTGAFTVRNPSVSNVPAPSGSTTSGSPAVDFDASKVARAGTETFGKHGVGVWGIVLFGAVSNPGAADAAALATSYANQQAAITELLLKRRTFAGAPVSLAGQQSVTLAGIPAWARRIRLHVWDSTMSTTGACSVRAGVGGSPVTSNYGGVFCNHAASSLATNNSATDEMWISPNNVAALGRGVITFSKTIGGDGSAMWLIESNFAAVGNMYDARGSVSVTGDISQVEIKRVTAGQTFTGGSVSVSWE